MRPLIGITVDVEERRGRERASAGLDYAQCVVRAGGSPVLLPPLVEELARHLDLCDAVVLTGGDDPGMEAFGEATHPKATRVRPIRQAYETALLERIDPDAPVLGVCLGMQMMALVAGGKLDQHMPETMGDAAARHWDNDHAVRPVEGAGQVMVGAAVEAGVIHSRHRQRVIDAGSLVVTAVSDDGVIEAVTDTARHFYLGVQWHPERTAAHALGQGLFDRLVEGARVRAEQSGGAGLRAGTAGDPP